LETIVEASVTQIGAQKCIRRSTSPSPVPIKGKSNEGPDKRQEDVLPYIVEVFAPVESDTFLRFWVYVNRARKQSNAFKPHKNNELPLNPVGISLDSV
jgi:hypothetical protein